MGRSVERQLEQDVGRCRAQLSDARRLLLQAQERESLFQNRLEQLRTDGGSSAGGYSSGGRGGGQQPSRRRELPSVEEELQRLKREMGK